ncbi:methyltransferase [Amycolatopsis mediterranei]|nr:methyltransferase [Amycolatopsis mediterranei]UZF72386.1 methyltransferase [Amycolatopsis mediterranei]
MPETDRLLVTIGRLSAPGSRFAFDHMDRSAIDRAVMRETADTIKGLGAAFKSTLDNPVEWPAGHGWRAGIARMPELGIRYGRPLPDVVDPTSANATLLCAATVATG